MKVDMINDNPSKSLIYFAIPMVIGNLFQQLYSVMDSIILGNFVGEEALAAVGSCVGIVMLFIAIATGASVGCSVVISQLFGAKKIEDMKTSIFTALISVVCIGVILSIIGNIINRKLLNIMGTPDNIIDKSSLYLRVYFYGLTFLFIYNVLAAIFNALGESKIPLYFLIFSSVLNIILDMVFVVYFKLDVIGVGLALIISQSISSIVLFIFLLKKIRKFKSKDSFSYFSVSELIQMGKVAVPSVLQQSLVSLGMLMVQIVVNRYGSSVMAGYAAAVKIDGVALMPMVTIGNAISTFTAQNIGANKPNRIKSAYRASLGMIAFISLSITALIYIFGERFLSVFLDINSSREAISTGIQYLRVVSLFYIVMGFMNVTNGVLRGAADIYVYLLSSLTNLGARIGLTFYLGDVVGKDVIWWAIPVGWILSYIVSIIRYKSGKWKNKALIK